MNPLVSRTAKMARYRHRGALLSLLEKEALLRRVLIEASGRITIESQRWNEYWEPVQALGLREVTDRLQALEQVWRHYIWTGFDAAVRRKLCFRYFDLLNSLLKECQTRPSCEARKRGLQKILAFECFSVQAAGGGKASVAAGTTTLRNPCYLVSKLKTPDALDDCQFLPLVTVSESEHPTVFYHYRQHKLSIDSENSLLLYVAEPLAVRSRSFQVINKLEELIARGTDPRAGERAKLVAQGVVLPYLQGSLSTEASAGYQTEEFELIDLGAGSGILGARLCQHISRFLQTRGVKPRIRVWMVDVSLAQPKRFFGS